MVGSHKVLTFSHGAFSCSLEGFDDPFETMKAIVEYFRALSVDDSFPKIGSPMPAAELLARIASEGVLGRVEGLTKAGRLVLRVAPVAGLDSGSAMESVAMPFATTPAKAEPVVTPPAPAKLGVLVLSNADAVAAGRQNRRAMTGLLDGWPPETVGAPEAAESASGSPVSIDERDRDADASVAPSDGVPDPFDLDGALRSTSVEAETILDDEAEVGELLRLDGRMMGALSFAVPSRAPGAAAPTARARVIRLRRAEFEEAIETGILVEGSFGLAVQAADGTATLAAATEPGPTAHAITDDIHQRDPILADVEPEVLPEAIVEPDPTILDGATPLRRYTLSAEAKADLLAELAGRRVERRDPDETPDSEVDAGTDTSSGEDVDEDALLEAVRAGAAPSEADDAMVANMDASWADAEPERPILRKRAQVAAELDDDDDGAYLNLFADDPRDDGESNRPDATALGEEEVDNLFAGDPGDVPMNEETRGAGDEPEREDGAGDGAAPPAADVPAAADAGTSVSVGSARAVVKPRRATLGPALDGDEAALSRILSRTDAHLAEPGASRRRSAITQLKAAVAATEAARRMGEVLPSEAGRADPFRADLRKAVHPRRPVAGSDGVRLNRPRTPPLKLVPSQRIDRPADVKPLASGKKPIRPRRVVVGGVLPPVVRETILTPPPPVDVPAIPPTGSFGEFAASMGVVSLTDIFEAAAAYVTFIEGSEDFSRPQIIDKVRQVTTTDFSREEGLRSFGMLLRQGRIARVRGGRFQVNGESRFNPGRRGV